MRIVVLVVPDCPNGPVVTGRLAQVLAGRADVEVETRVIETAEQAERWGMHGSPTVLVDGRDPFAAPGTQASVSCRLYRDEGGRAQGAPSLARLREALDGQEESRARGRGRGIGRQGRAGTSGPGRRRMAGSAPGGAARLRPRFFASRESAEQFAARHPEAEGTILDQQAAQHLGEEIFGPLLRTAGWPDARCHGFGTASTVSGAPRRPHNPGLLQLRRAQSSSC